MESAKAIHRVTPAGDGADFVEGRPGFQSGWLLFASATALLFLALAGCHKTGPRPVTYTSGSVRLDALLTLHPAWEDVRRLDSLLARARNPPAPSVQAAVPLGEAPLPPPLQVGGEVPENLARARAERVTEPAIERVEHLRTTLNVRNDHILRREQEAGRKDVEADVARRQTDLLAGVDQEEQSLRDGAQRKIRDLRFREIALQSQVDALSGPPREDAQRKLTDKRQEIADAETALKNELAAVHTGIDQQVEKYRKEREEIEQQRLRRIAERLNREADQTIAENTAEVGRISETLKPLAMPSVPRTPAISAVRLPSPARVAASVPSTTAARSDAAIGSGIAALTAQRERLIQFIRADVRRHVERLAAQKQWRISFAETSGLPDMTQQVADSLREEWKP